MASLYHPNIASNSILGDSGTIKGRAGRVGGSSKASYDGVNQCNNEDRSNLRIPVEKCRIDVLLKVVG